MKHVKPYSLFAAKLDEGELSQIVKRDWMGKLDAQSLQDSINNKLELREEATADELAELAESDDLETLVWVAGHPNASVETLIKLADNEHWEVRSTVGFNPNTPDEVVLRLSKDDPKDSVRVGVSNRARKIRNSMVANASADELAELARSNDWEMQLAVAQYDDAPGHILQELATHRDEWVRRAVADHPNTPDEVILRLAQDESQYVRNEALPRLEKIRKRQEEELKGYGWSDDAIGLARQLGL